MAYPMISPDIFLHCAHQSGVSRNTVAEPKSVGIKALLSAERKAFKT